MSDTIFALSSGMPPSAIAVMRISGPTAITAAASLMTTLPQPRHAALRLLRDPGDATLLDRALVLILPGPRTSTGEDLVELHLHGGRAVVDAISLTLSGIAGLRAAAPGEFTRRALANGVIDLTEAEGLGDLLAAETESQRRAALDVVQGGVRQIVDRLAGRLLDIAASVEAQLDFSDEDDVSGASLSAIQAELRELGAEIDQYLAAAPIERLRDGVRVVIAGPPNSGKSTLLNRLADRDAAIVSAIAGTTRDMIEVPIVRGGIVYVLIDTAGLHDDSIDPIELIGIDRARGAIGIADIVLWLGDDTPPDVSPSIWVQPRSDLPGRDVTNDARLAVSARTGFGIDALWAGLAASAAAMLPRENEVALNRRQRMGLIQCAEHLTVATDLGEELLIAEELRLAMRALDEVVGRVGTEQMLDALFARFCIGK